MSCLVESFENATAPDAAAWESKKRSASVSWPKKAGGVYGGIKRNLARGGSAEVGVTWADKYSVAEARAEGGDKAHSGPFQVVEMGVSGSAQSTQRGKLPGAEAIGAAGTRPPVKTSRRVRTAPLPPKSSLTMKKQGRLTQSPAPVGPDAKRALEEEERQQRQARGRKKREVRARRKAKERARRRLYDLAAEDGADAGNGSNKSPRNKKHSRSFSKGKEGKEESSVGPETVHHDEFPTILQPTAPRGAEQAGGTSTERAEHLERAIHGKTGEKARSDGGGPSFCKGAVGIGGAMVVGGTEATRQTSGVQPEERGMDAAGALPPDEATTSGASSGGSSGRRRQCQSEEYPGLLLRPTAPTQRSREEAYRAEGTFGRQRGDEGVGLSSTGSVEELANSEYGEEDFEIE